MLCRFCSYDFGNVGGAESIAPILNHVGTEHPVGLMNLCVRLPIELEGPFIPHAVFEGVPNKQEKIRPIRTPEMNKELLMLQADAIGRIAPLSDAEKFSEDIEAFEERERTIDEYTLLDLSQGLIRSKEDY